MEAKTKGTLDDVKHAYMRKLGELGVNQDAQETVTEFIMDQTRKQWLKGKDTGWKNAMQWKRVNAPVAAEPVTA